MESWYDTRQQTRDASLLPSFQTSCAVKWPGHEADHFHRVLRVIMSGAIPPLPLVPSWHAKGKTSPSTTYL